MTNEAGLEFENDNYDEMERLAGINTAAANSDDSRQKVLEWLFNGDTGISSKSLAAEFLGVDNKRKGRFYCYPPSDPSDLGRCLRLIEVAPAVRACVDTLAEKSDSWAKIAPVWDKITESMKKEVGINWEKGNSAPLTYEMMKAAGV